MLTKENFKFIKEIGRGGFSTVYKVIDYEGLVSNKGDILAIKIIDKKNINMDVLDTEISIFNLIKKHDNINIVKLYSYFEEDGYLFIIMEYINGLEMLDYVSYSNNSDDDTIKNIIKQMSNAIKFLHDRDITHGDIKLENFLITKKHRIVLIDFGLSTVGNNPIFRKKGTAMYAAPELIFLDSETGYIGKKIDMWALGTVIYILKYKNYPFLGRSLRGLPNIFINEYDKLAYINDQIHHPLKFKGNPFIPIINGLIRKDVDKRLSTEEFIILVNKINK